MATGWPQTVMKGSVSEAVDAALADELHDARQKSRRRTPFLVWAMLSLGLLGLILSLLPWESVLQSCPYLVRQAFFSPSNLFSGTSASEAPASNGVMPVARGFDHETGLPLFAEADLKGYDGTNGRRILLGMGGDVFDVTEKGSQFYGPGAAYSLFAARDSSRCLALGSLQQEDLDLGGDISDFNEQQMGQFKEQHEFYLGKYPRVGKLIPRRKS